MLWCVFTNFGLRPRRLHGSTPFLSSLQSTRSPTLNLKLNPIPTTLASQVQSKQSPTEPKAELNLKSQAQANTPAHAHTHAVAKRSSRATPATVKPSQTNPIPSHPPILSHPTPARSAAPHCRHRTAPHRHVLSRFTPPRSGPPLHIARTGRSPLRTTTPHIPHMRNCALGRRTSYTD